MITNERQYRAAKTQLEKFERAASEFSERASIDAGIDPLIARAQGEGLRDQVRELRRELAAYERLSRSGPKAFSATALVQIPAVLIKARIASGLSQKALAERVGLKEQQIQRYESERYKGASLARLHQISNALGLKWQLHAQTNGDEQTLEADAASIKRASSGRGRSIVAARKTPVVTARKAGHADHASLVSLLIRSGRERGIAVDAGAVALHVQKALDEDMSFIAFAGDEPVGAITCRRIDVGFRRLDAFESDYFYLTSEHRSLDAISELLGALKSLAVERDVEVCVHTLEYLAPDQIHAPVASRMDAKDWHAAEPQIERVVVNPQALDFGEEEEAVASPPSKRAGLSSRTSRD